MKFIIIQLKTKFTNADFVTNLLVILMLLIAGLESLSAQCPTPPGDPTVYGTNAWIGYVYSGLDNNNPPQNAFTGTVYRGYITQSEQFNMNLGNAAVSGPNVCGSYADSFSLRFRMRKTYPAGYYTITVGGDDGYRLSLDGGTSWFISDWNYHAYQTTTTTIFLNGTYDLVLENYDQGGQSQVSFAYTYCGTYSTPPTDISGNNNICNGSGTTLTANGGFLSTGSYHQWGTGSTVGANAIAGQTGASITVAPTANTTYWVRRIDPGCNNQTAGVTYAVNVTTGSTAPTSISGNTSVCAGAGTTLTATGGNLAAGSVYEWGTGTVGTNIIPGETAASITVTPATNTTYWVRRTNAAPCTTTAAATVAVTVNTVPGDQVTYGNDSWIGYVYATIGTANPPADAFSVPYRGYITQPEIFNQNWGSTPLSGATICGSYPSRFSIRFKMTKNFTPGYYTFTVGGDDGYRLSLDGGATFVVSNWTDHGYATSTTASYYLSGSTNLVLEYYEQGGLAQVSFNYTACTDFSTAPTTISGDTTVCRNTNATLTASGGYAAPGSYYQWGTGTTVGNAVINGQTGASITVTLGTTNTTYWVRRIDPAPCNLTTGGTTQLVTVVAPSGAPTNITGTVTICEGNSTTLTATGGTAAAGSVYEWGTGNTLGVNPISGETGVSITVSPAASTTYWVRRVDAAPCNTTSGGVTKNVTVNNMSTAPTSISNATALCSPVGGITLTAIGGTSASGSTTYQWGIGSVVGSGTVGNTSSTYYVNPSAVTTYWVRRYDPAPCNTFTSGVTVTVYPVSSAPTSITGTNTICSGASTTLTATGGTTSAIGSFEWGTGATIGSNPIAGATGSTLTVSPTGNTTYWVRRTDASPCNSSTNGVTYNVTVNATSTAPTSINNVATACSPVGGITLNAIGGSGSNTYQWGTGSVVGSNPIGGQTNSSYYVNPTVVTTYWVRRYDAAPCNSYTSGVTITVYPVSSAPTSLTGTNTICSGASTTLTATGGTTSAIGSFEWGTGATIGSNPIAGATGSTLTVSPTGNTTYWVRRTDASPCNSSTNGVTYNVTVNATSTAPTSINNAATACSPVGGLTLNAIGGSGSNTYQWGTGSVVGSNPIGGQTNSSYYVNPTVVTTYWVRRYDAAPCNSYTSGVTITVYPVSSAPTSISGTNLICNGSSTTLTASGGTTSAIGSFEWGSGAVGSNIIAGATTASVTVSPTTTTTYWVRRTDASPCNSTTGSTSFTVTVSQKSIAPTSISGPASLCYTSGGGTLTANGAVPGTNATYQWGTGAVGTNIQGSTVNTMYINPTADTTYWVRMIDAAPCNTVSAAVTFNVTVNTTSTNVTGISGATNICNGSATTLTATGGSLGVGAAYQWGTGNTLGTNIIPGANGVSITVNPNATTTYWVRRVDGAPCTTTTWGPNVTVTVNDKSSAPTAITGGANGCPGTAMTLTATGGTAAAGATYQWGTGSTVGSNVIAGQNGVSINVSPTVTTTYWVRRYDAAPCNAYTTGTATTVTIAAAGDPSVFGTNEWLVYGYATGDITLATAVYAGYYTQTTLGFDTQASWNNSLSPSSASNWNGCNVPVDNFTFVHKRRGFPCGAYTLTMANWDDNTDVYVNGTLVWSCGSWSGGGACSGTVGTYNLNSSSTIEVRTREYGGGANAAMTITNISVTSTAPTALAAAADVICAGETTTLTASGGTTGSNGIYQWGTGSVVGNNIISGENAASIVVSPTSTTQYWVRRINSFCGQTTTGITKTITIAPFAVAGTLSSAQTVICSNTTPSSITVSGFTGNIVKWQYANNPAFTSGVTDINVTTATLSPAAMGTFSTTRYFRAVVKSCDLVYTSPIAINVPTAVTYSNGSWSGTPTENTPVIINSNLTIASDLHVCSCQIKNGATVTVNSNKNLIVQTSLEVEPLAQLIVADKGSLVQIDDSATDMGSIKVKRDSQPMKTYDYTYWSAPVQGNTLNQLSPNTLSDKYYRFDPMINNWVSIAGGNAMMEAGKGYIVRAPQGWSLTNATAGVYKAEFNGVPNNGVISATIQRGNGLSNLIGNPYPSAIDIDLFLTDPANTNIVLGTVYLWTHNTAISSSTPGNYLYNYAADDYAKYNLTGGVRSANPAITGGLIPDGKVASGQAFFIEANAGLGNGTYAATFRNSMRIAGHNDQFYRNSNNTAQNSRAVQTAPAEKNRLWIDLTNTGGAYNEALIGYVEGATNDFDPLYDGKTMPAGNVLSLYSIAGTNQYSIQGKALPFENSHRIPMGYKTTIAGNFTLSLAQFDGLFAGESVYLEDHLLQLTHNLKAGAYNFSSAIGTFNDRFEIKFVNAARSETTSTTSDDNVFVTANEKQVAVRSDLTIQEVSVFDLLGRKIYGAQNINALQFRTGLLTSSEQVLIVKVIREGGLQTTQKVIMQ